MALRLREWWGGIPGGSRSGTLIKIDERAEGPRRRGAPRLVIFCVDMRSSGNRGS